MTPASLGTDRRCSSAARLRARTEAALGFPVTLHAFRHSATTTVALEAPNWIGIASGVLAHQDPRAAERQYNLAAGVSASVACAATLKRRCKLALPKRRKDQGGQEL